MNSENIVAGKFQHGKWRNGDNAHGLMPAIHSIAGRLSNEAKDIRDQICDYFNSAIGAVPWQRKMVGLE